MEKPKVMAAIWGAPILFELVAAGLTAAKAYVHRKAVAKSRLLWVLYRDAAIVFTTILSLRTMNLMIWLFGPLSLIFVGIYFIWSLVTVIIGRMLLNLRGVSTPDEWGNANDAKLHGILQDLPVLIIGNPNRDINSQGEIVTNEPTYTESEGWPKNYEMARSRSVNETFYSEEPGDVTNQEKSQSLGIKTPKEARRASEIRGHDHDLKLKGGGTLEPIASGSRSAAATPVSSPRTLVHQLGTFEFGAKAMGAPISS